MRKLILLFFVLLPLSGFSQEVGKEAPLFTGYSASGDTIKLSDFSGKVIILDFWASWCGPCKEEFPFLIDLYNKYSEKDFSVLAVNVDENSSSMNKFLSGINKDVPFKIISDRKSKIPELYNLDAMPSSFVIDKKGVVRYAHTGFTKSDKEKFINEIEKILNE